LGRLREIGFLDERMMVLQVENSMFLLYHCLVLVRSREIGFLVEVIVVEEYLKMRIR